MFRELVKHTNKRSDSESRGKGQIFVLFSAKEGVPATGLRWGKSRELGRRESCARMEMDNFFCSHRCTSDVRLWLGARRCSNTNASRYLVLLTHS